VRFGLLCGIADVNDLDFAIFLETGARRNEVAMMTFSLNPRRQSTLPRVAASVRTRVVSAAEMKLSVSVRPW
jgi:hypothetical protein